MVTLTCDNLVLEHSGRDIQRKKRCLIFSWACIAVATGMAQSPALELPPRSADARPASDLLRDWAETTGTALQKSFQHELLAGNVPDYIRKLWPVSWKTVLADANGTLRVHNATIYTTPDYLTIGTDSDHFRTPLMPGVAQSIADATSTTLPTRLMVDKIYAASEKYAPRPFSPVVYTISNLDVWVSSSKTIDGQIEHPGELVAGIKKDVVITNRLAEPATSPRVAIYGWHKLTNARIQPLTLVHAATYVDYSHGTRLISNQMVLDGQTTSVQSVLQDPVYWPVLSDERPFTSSTLRYPALKL